MTMIGNQTYDSVQDFIDNYLDNNRLAEVVEYDDEKVIFKMADGRLDTYEIDD